MFSIAWITYCAWNSDIACLLDRIGVHTGAGGRTKFKALTLPKPYTQDGGDSRPNACSMTAANRMWRGFRSAG